MVDAYPEAAGQCGIDTSIEAAEAINESLPRLQRSVLGVIAAASHRGATGDEIASVLGWERFRVRPRTSELRVAGKIMDSGRRRLSLAGINSIVWVLPSNVADGSCSPSQGSGGDDA